MRFVKMHGLLNDYVYVNTFAERVDDPSAVARRVSDRHRGIGSDGLILLGPPRDGVDADIRMRMFNVDGLESEMCGNGLRCVAKLAFDHGVCRNNPMRVETGRDVLTVWLTLDALGRADLVTVDMGAPILEAARVPVDAGGAAKAIDYPVGSLVTWPAVVGQEDWLTRCGLDPRLTAVSMGNPHGVFYCKDVSQVPLEVIGPVLEHHALFPRRANVHFAEVVSRGEVVMRTWERGSGVTLACGTGASAVCVAGVLTGRTDRRLMVRVLGGVMTLEWVEADNHIRMTGPAVEVFSGDWPEGA